MKIYTKTGDKGQTALYGGGRIDKDALRIKVIGNVDELNSILGISLSSVYRAQAAHGKINSIPALILREQSNMLRLGADFATPLDARDNFQTKVHRMVDGDIMILEKEIDEWDAQLAKLTQFILPGGSEASAFIHHARSVCRRCEREAVALAKSENLNEHALRYLNRLSDWLFQLARYVNYLQDIEDSFAK